MPVIDFESAWYELKAHIGQKRSHSARELAEAMAKIEVDHRLPEGQEGFDGRPLPQHRSPSHRPADDEPNDLREPAHVVSAAS
jgi:hypothetical protein